MPSANPFLRAFFRSTLLSECNPVSHHILLVPPTEVLLTHRDRESNTDLAEFVTTEEFLASHVIRAPPPTAADSGSSIREMRGKARQYTTVNGKTVVIKDSTIYTNKGFRNLNQAQVLVDALYNSENYDSQQWLLYYISRPLLGTIEPVGIPIAILPSPTDGQRAPAVPMTAEVNGSSSVERETPAKKNIKGLGDLFSHFPLIARQMQPTLGDAIEKFKADVGKPLPAPVPEIVPASRSRASSVSSASNTNVSGRSRGSKRRSRTYSTEGMSAYADDEEEHMRSTLDRAITAAIGAFQKVEKRQVALLGSTTNLTGPTIERLIEQHVVEQVHDAVLFPRICQIHQGIDGLLERQIHQMTSIDVTQVGIEIENGRAGKRAMVVRLNAAVTSFRKLETAGSPHQMLEAVLETLKIIAGSTLGSGVPEPPAGATGLSEKTPMTMNADTLVSLLLLVVIRSQARHLQARLAYMRGFIFIEDVDNGETGYAMSTLEAVLQYLAADAGGIKLASRRNRRLWHATKSGDLSEMAKILEPEEDTAAEEMDDDPSDEQRLQSNGVDSAAHSINGFKAYSDIASASTLYTPGFSEDGDLSHVFPFQTRVSQDQANGRPHPIKRVSLDLRSLSSASEYSFASHTSTLDSSSAAIEGDTSIEKLCGTENQLGHSVMMMAVEAKQPAALSYLLSLDKYFDPEMVLGDCSADGKTLLSAAVQTANIELIDILVKYVFDVDDEEAIRDYISKRDEEGRTVAHYLFNAPDLVRKFGTWLPWRSRDKNGQTPLLALCRSYDHPSYLDMVNDALQFASEEQGDGELLHLDNHVDSKGNTLLHVVNDPYLALRILQFCDVDPNAPNKKHFTPLMVASKFGRYDMVRVMFLDQRIDLEAREYRGLTAVELAKDDDVRNRIDDMVLVSNVPAPDGRVTALVRSFLVEDQTIRLIIKSASRGADGMISVTTCRRSVADFEHLVRWLAVEHPASWLPSAFNYRSPFQIPSKPSRALLRDVQLRLNEFLRLMIAHSTFSAHELLWEFILAPEIQPDMMAERSLKKSEIRQEKVREEYAPIENFADVQTFVVHAQDSIRIVNRATKSVLRRGNRFRNTSHDFHVLCGLAAESICTLHFLPPSHCSALRKYVDAVCPPPSDPFDQLHSSLSAVLASILAILSALARPHAIITEIQATQKTLARQSSSLRRSERWPLGFLLEDALKQNSLSGSGGDAQARIAKTKEDIRLARCELSYTRQTVAGELAEWQALHATMVRRILKRLARDTVVKERSRLDQMKRALRMVNQR